MDIFTLLTTVYRMTRNADPGSWADHIPAGTFTLSYAR